MGGRGGCGWVTGWEARGGQESSRRAASSSAVRLCPTLCTKSEYEIWSAVWSRNVPGTNACGQAGRGEEGAIRAHASCACALRACMEHKTWACSPGNLRPAPPRPALVRPPKSPACACAPSTPAATACGRPLSSWRRPSPAISRPPRLQVQGGKRWGMQGWERGNATLRRCGCSTFHPSRCSGGGRSSSRSGNSSKRSSSRRTHRPTQTPCGATGCWQSTAWPPRRWRYPDPARVGTGGGGGGAPGSQSG